MDAFALARREARRWRRGASLGTSEERRSGDRPAEPWVPAEHASAVIARLLTAHGLELIPLRPDDVLLLGARAVLDRDVAAIFVREDLGDDEKAACVAHELGHLALHPGGAVCDDEDLGRAERGLEAYSARERQETQANVFARELLLPCPLARHLFSAGLGARQIAEAQGIPLELVRRQLCEALLLPEPEEKSTPPEPGLQEQASDSPGPAPPLTLDPSQRRAAEHEGAPLLLTAGPGTGKTRTLVGRILHLLERGADPGSIVALTFSSRAAEEITERVARHAPEAASKLWTGTFHAFGLELLRRHHELAGLEADLRVIDRADAISLLEDRLPTLGLRHYQNLYEPALALQDLTAAISRAKDELVDAEGYRRLAESMARRAVDAEQHTTAEKALEVAGVYAVYQDLLASKGLVDFGDLIAHPARLLESHGHVRSMVRLRHRHLLVDEYQDVNRASGRLLKLLVGRGDRLWVVGDLRQSIYRFRGASGANLDDFEADFPTARRLTLGVCYRSKAEIVRTVEAFGAGMDLGAPPHRRREAAPPSPSLEAHRGTGGEIPRLIEAPAPHQEIAAVATEARRLVGQGIPLSHQAVLCRTHRQIERMAEGLAAEGLRVLHLGSLFERCEVRDLLSVLCVLVDPPGGALMRLAGTEPYAMPIQDVYDFLHWRRNLDLPIREALPRSEEAPVSEQARGALLQLATDLAGLELTSSPWELLTEFLFDRSHLLRGWLRDGDPVRLVAIHQFLLFVRGRVGGGRGWPARRLLDRVRRLVLLGEERDLRRVPSQAQTLDAIRLLTLHAAKGLEFDAVHLPGLVRGSLPGRFRPSRCPAPVGLTGGDPEAAAPERIAHGHDELCLAYVALSRARDRLLLYRHRESGGRRRRASPFLDVLVPHLEVERFSAEKAHSGPEAAGASLHFLAPPPSHLDGGDFQLYERCPRRYFYSRLFELPGWRRRGAFADTHRALYAVIDWLRVRGGAGGDELRHQLAEAWGELGPTGHAFEAQYRALAERLVDRLAEISSDPAASPAKILELPLGITDAGLHPDLASSLADGTPVLRFLRTGGTGSFTADDTVHGLIQEAARHHYGTGGARLEVHHLTDGGRTPILLSQRKVESRLEKARGIAADIHAGRFEADPEARKCPRCPYFFLCPALPEGALRLRPEEARSEVGKRLSSADDPDPQSAARRRPPRADR